MAGLVAVLLAVALAAASTVMAAGPHAAGPLVITATPSTAAPGEKLTISGTGFVADDTVDIVLQPQTTPLTTTQADATGSIAGIVISIPPTFTLGGHFLELTGHSSKQTASTQITLATKLSVFPTTLMPGEEAQLSAAGLVPNSVADVLLSPDTRPLASPQVSISGTVDMSVTVPVTSAPGQHTLSLIGRAEHRVASASVTVKPVTATLTLTPTTANRGGLVTVSGRGFVPNEAITITIPGVSSPLALARADTHGQLPPTGVGVPYGVAVGVQTLRVISASGRAASANVSVQMLTPHLKINTPTAQPGVTVTMTGSDFGLQERVTLSLNGAAVDTSPTVITTSNGAFTATMVVPDSLLRGMNTLGAIGNESRVSAVVNVTGERNLAASLYFAGATSTHGNHSSLPILNANAQPAHVDLTFFYDSGPSRQVSLDVPGHSRTTADLNALAGENRVFGVKLTADRLVTAELRVQREGKDGYRLLGVPAPDTTWYLAEGYTGLTFHETLNLVNPGQAPSQVQLHLLPFGGQPSRIVELAVPPQSIRAVDVNALMPHLSLSVIASASQPIVVARTLTFSDGGYGATAKAGVTNPATSWIFAEGTTTTRFQTFLTILNPDTVPAQVTASFYGRTGNSLGSRTILVPPLSRDNIKLNDFLDASAIASVVTSNLPVVVERPMYFGSPNDAHVSGGDVFGRNGAGVSWSFPGGDTNGNNEYLLIYNPSPQTVSIDATFYGSGGSTTTKHIAVPPTVRYNVNVNTLLPGLAVQHGIVLKSASGLGFVAEQTIFSPNFSSLANSEGYAS
jgi:hypothetical protein